MTIEIIDMNYEKVIKDIIKKTKMPFFSESEFQIYLATQLANKLGKGYKIELEKKIGNKYRIDIAIFHKDTPICYIETKYKLKVEITRPKQIKNACPIICNRSNIISTEIFQRDIEKLSNIEKETGEKVKHKLVVFITSKKIEEFTLEKLENIIKDKPLFYYVKKIN